MAKNAAAFRSIARRQNASPMVSIGALVDGSLINMKGPPEDVEPHYVDRKSNHSINAQVKEALLSMGVVVVVLGGSGGTTKEQHEKGRAA